MSLFLAKSTKTDYSNAIVMICKYQTTFVVTTEHKQQKVQFL